MSGVICHKEPGHISGSLTHLNGTILSVACSQEQKRNRRSRRRNSRQAMLLDPDRQDSMTEDGEGRSRSESMLDVARGLSASLQNIRRSDRLPLSPSLLPCCPPFPAAGSAMVCLGSDRLQVGSHVAPTLNPPPLPPPLHVHTFIWGQAGCNLPPICATPPPPRRPSLSVQWLVSGSGRLMSSSSPTQLYLIPAGEPEYFLP